MTFTVENIYYLFLILLLFEFIVGYVLGFLNRRRLSEELPEELSGIYDEEKYKKSIAYEKEKYKYGKISGLIFTGVIVTFVYFGFFGEIYNYIYSFGFGEISSSLLFFFVLLLGQSILTLPFTYYYTFVIEQKYGFNKSTKSIFFTDFIKTLILTTIIGGMILTLIMLIYFFIPKYFWLLAWGIMVFFSVFMMMFYSSIIVPLFNKQTPLEDGPLRRKIEDFSNKAGFKLDNIFVIDGSKRSSKANAYFSGFGPKKRIVLFDTLIKDLTDDELVAVLAHEIGHYKKKHTLQMLFFSVIQTGIIFFILGLVLKYPEFSQALGANASSFSIGLLAFSILFSPISMIFGIFGNVLSRRNEYQADKYSSENFSGKDLQNALIKLSKNNLSNLRPHPAYEFFYYSHPTVLKRLKALENIG